VADANYLGDASLVLKRMFESNRFNIGLNYVSGLIHLLLDSFNEPDGKNRFELALDRMVSENYDFLPVLKNTFRLMDIYNIDAGKREMLGSSLIAFIPKYAEYQYKNLKDTHSLAYLLKQAASKINDIGGSLDGRL
jgi:ATP-dependent DNA helicase RecQ